jgi:acetate kinase
MKNAIAVLNAGSSSIKFSLFDLGSDQTVLLSRGQVESLFTTPRFVARNGEGVVTADKSWPQGTKLGHDGAIEHLFAHVRAEFANCRLIGIGHRVVHGGLEYTEPVRVTPEVLAGLERLVPLVPLHQPHNLALPPMLARSANYPKSERAQHDLNMQPPDP